MLAGSSGLWRVRSIAIFFYACNALKTSRVHVICNRDNIDPSEPKRDFYLHLEHEEGHLHTTLSQ